MAESTLGRAYRVLYEALCGRHPNPLPWHWQWLPSHLLNRDFKVELPKLNGRLLDIGCGQKPYRRLLASVDEYVGADVAAGPTVDVLIAPGKPLPLQDGQFDAVMTTQVLEYVENPAEFVAEIRRVLKPGGVVVITFPFILQEHGPGDLVRYSVQAIDKMFTGWSVVRISRQGGAGSTIAILFLNWVNQSMNLTRPVRLVRPLLLPLWLPFCLLVNLLALILDKCDRTACYYSNVLAVLRKNTGPGDAHG